MRKRKREKGRNEIFNFAAYNVDIIKKTYRIVQNCILTISRCLEERKLTMKLALM